MSFFSSFLCRICDMYPLFTISCSTSLEWYALSRHRFCFLFLFVVVDVVDVDDDDNDDGLLITMLSTVSIATVTSWVFADVIMTDIMEYHLYLLGYVFWFLLIYSLSVGLCPVIAPLKAILLIYYYLEIASSTLFPPPFFCYRIFLAIYSFFIKYAYLFPFMKSSMTCWARPIFFR